MGRVGRIECSDFRYILKREPTEFLDGVNMTYEEREIRSTPNLQCILQHSADVKEGPHR